MTRDQDAIALAERVLAILDEGSFSSTYKYALFIAILDLCIEKTEARGAPPSSLTTRELAVKVVELCWNHVAPYGTHGTLRFGGGRGEQAEILRRIENVRARWGDERSDTVFRFQTVHPEQYERLLDSVEWKLIEMPIPRLQRLGRGEEDRFLYEYNWSVPVRRSVVTAYQEKAPEAFANSLSLQPGVAEGLVRLNGLLRPIFYREWAVRVAKLNNLPEAGLESFLFDVDRASLDPVREPLSNLQGRRCFYCEGRIGSRADVDHFIPWSRYRDNGLDNLVTAHGRCNNSKRDFLASAEHVEHWVERACRLDADLTVLAQACGWPRDRERSAAVARAVYLRLPANARLWRSPDEFDPMDHARISRALVPNKHDS
jgi:HNH endonuclease